MCQPASGCALSFNKANKTATPFPFPACCAWKSTVTPETHSILGLAVPKKDALKNSYLPPFLAQIAPWMSRVRQEVVDHGWLPLSLVCSPEIPERFFLHSLNPCSLSSPAFAHSESETVLLSAGLQQSEVIHRE